MIRAMSVCQSGECFDDSEAIPIIDLRIVGEQAICQFCYEHPEEPPPEGTPSWENLPRVTFDHLSE